MNWYPTDCKPGDIVRIKLGSIYHYGIFVSEDQVIQFGMPPIEQYRLPAEQVKVLSTDIDTFSCNNIIEVASYTKKELKEKFSAKDVIKRAQDSIGQGGYNLLHNNCEHFVNYCVFDRRVCSVEEEAMEKWRSRPIFDIYFCNCSEKTDSVKSALDHSFKLENDNIIFNKYGCGKLSNFNAYYCFFENDTLKIAAVSNKPCAVSAESLINYTDKNDCISFANKKSLKIISSFYNIFMRKKYVSDDFLVKTLDNNIISLCGENIKFAKFYKLEYKNKIPSITLLGNEEFNSL